MGSSDVMYEYDLAVIGGGINGAGIARDAAGRGLKVLLLEQGDLASATSSASSKLVHGGLRYLEYYEFRLVREALKEREILLGIAPHIIWPLDFLLPLGAHTRPGWLIGLGMWLYDHLAPRGSLRKSGKATLWGEVLKDKYFHAYRYADCWVDDARLVVLNARDAADRGADIRTRTACAGLERSGGKWRVTLATGEVLQAKAVVNAAGPWVAQVAGMAGVRRESSVRLVKGSHIVVPRIHRGNHAYILQLPDKRILFILPFQEEFSLVGTTDVPFDGDAAQAGISPEETHYLLDAVNGYLARPLSEQDIVWSYAGVRSLYDDRRADASAVTRDYVLELDTDDDGAAPLLTIFGGKITTYRKLAVKAMEKLLPFFPQAAPEEWTGKAPLPGGEAYDVPSGLSNALARRWRRQYGARMCDIPGDEPLGEPVAGDIYPCELRYARDHEWARTGDDFLWRRTKQGLFLNAQEKGLIEAWFVQNSPQK